MRKSLFLFYVFSVFFLCIPDLKSEEVDDSHFYITASKHSANIMEPQSYRNLQIFLIAGDQALGQKSYITLSEAMDKKIVKVYETGNVQQLSMENTSKDQFVFIHSGDIVKGGKQDRTVRFDVILPPKSGVVPLDSFCVEAGRWRKRGGEEAGKFSENSATLSSRDLKMAAKYGQNQGQVWDNVAKQQDKLNENVQKLLGRKVNVKDATSNSSLQLTLENKDLKQAMQLYKNAFVSLVQKEKNVLGFAYAINGEIYGIDIYNNHVLFQKLWPKLLDAVITESIAEYDPQKSYKKAQRRDVLTIMQNPPKDRKKVRNINKQTTFITYQEEGMPQFETLDKDMNDTWLHKNYIKASTPLLEQDTRSNQIQQNQSGQIEFTQQQRIQNGEQE